MKVIVAGSRSIKSFDEVKHAIESSPYIITELVSGTARGVDQLGEVWARENGIPIKQFPAEWKKHGRAAGIIRNKQMADYADALIAVWDRKSKGTKHMIDTMLDLRKPIYVVYHELAFSVL